MKKAIFTTIFIIAMFALYKTQHIKPVDDPKESPLFQQRLKSSLNKFKDGEFPAGPDRMQAMKQSNRTPPSSLSTSRTKDPVVTGRCGRITLTWVEEKKIAKERIVIKRRTPDDAYAILKGSQIFDRAEEGGTRYWVSDSNLKDGTRYEYLIASKGANGKETIKGPVAINLTCNERDREIIAQREKTLKE